MHLKSFCGRYSWNNWHSDKQILMKSKWAQILTLLCPILTAQIVLSQTKSAGSILHSNNPKHPVTGWTGLHINTMQPLFPRAVQLLNSLSIMMWCVCTMFFLLHLCDDVWSLYYMFFFFESCFCFFHISISRRGCMWCIVTASPAVFEINSTSLAMWSINET